MWNVTDIHLSVIPVYSLQTHKPTAKPLALQGLPGRPLPPFLITHPQTSIPQSPLKKKETTLLHFAQKCISVTPQSTDIYADPRW